LTYIVVAATATSLISDSLSSLECRHSRRLNMSPYRHISAGPPVTAML